MNSDQAKMNRHKPSRKGSLLLLCTLAAVTLSLAGLAILQSHSRKLAMTKSTESSVHARMATDALMQQAIAQLRVDPTAKLMIVDKGSALPSAYGEVVPISKTQSQVSIFLYRDSKIPSLVKTIDMEKLAGTKPDTVKPSDDAPARRPVRPRGRIRILNR